MHKPATQKKSYLASSIVLTDAAMAPTLGLHPGGMVESDFSRQETPTRNLLLTEICST